MRTVNLVLHNIFKSLRLRNRIVAFAPNDRKLSMGKYDLQLHENEDTIPNSFPIGPLTPYRKQASFDWKILRSVLDDENHLKLKYKVWRTLEADTLFAHSPVSLSLEEERKITMERILRILDYDFLPEDEMAGDFRLVNTLMLAIGMYDWSVSIKKGLLTDFFRNTVRGLGSSKHYPYIDAVSKYQLFACFCLTEIGHGTNTKGMRTTATYEPSRKVFVLNTPDFEAAKCWAANLGKTATHALVFAQLNTLDGQTHGLHCFIVQIRDMNTLLPLPGITLGDMGAKLGLNGLDNGFAMFNNVEIPVDALLNKTGDVTPDGKYTTPYKDPKKKLGASLGNLSAGRVGITTMCAANLCKAVPIAVRYSAVRKQFGPVAAGGEELPIIEYQMQQWRLFPYLAAAYVMKYYGDNLVSTYINFVFNQYGDDVDKTELAETGAELHALSSSAKPLASWLARDAIQECREACGGHGYLLAAGLGQLRNDSDSNCTYEGDNNVLLQQTSNWLLGVWENLPTREKIPAPLGSLRFLADASTISVRKFNAKSVHQLFEPALLFETYHWLIIHLLKKTSIKLKSNMQSGSDSFTAKNDNQVFHARTLALVYIQHCTLDKFHQFYSDPNMDKPVAEVLKKLLLLYGYWSLEKHLGFLYEGGYAHQDTGALIQETILELCRQLKTDAVPLADVIAPPDFILNSVLGCADGNVYKNLQGAMLQTPAGLERPSWWTQVVERFGKSKL